MSAETFLAERDGRLGVVALTGIRSEYDLLQPLLAALDAAPEFDVGVIAAGAHPTPVHGHSIRQIEADGFEIVAVLNNLVAADSAAAKAVTAGNLLTGMAGVLDRVRPDLLVVLGDREEAVIGALAGTYLRVPVVHLAGGDHTHPVGGNIDEEVRHAATKLSHVHLTMADEHSERVRRLGEESWRVHTVGSGGIDKLRLTTRRSPAEMADLLGPAVLEPYVVVIHHPVHATASSAADEIELILDRVSTAGIHAFVGAPNTDTGSQEIVRAIDQWSSNDLVHPYRNLPREEFVTLLAGAKALVGNSSLGLHEAPFFGLPVVNVGERQRGRLAAANVDWVDAVADDLDAALGKAVHNEAYRAAVAGVECPYGDGHMSERTIEILRGLPPRARLLDKNLTF